MAQNWAVGGSDSAFSPLIEDLRKEGINVKSEHKKANITPDLGLVVHSQAISPQNPEYKEAKHLELPQTIKVSSKNIIKAISKFQFMTITHIIRQKLAQRSKRLKKNFRTLC